jgi:hypothetical protein
MPDSVPFQEFVSNFFLAQIADVQHSMPWCRGPQCVWNEGRWSAHYVSARRQHDVGSVLAYVHGKDTVSHREGASASGLARLSQLLVAE